MKIINWFLNLFRPKPKLNIEELLKDGVLQQELSGDPDGLIRSHFTKNYSSFAGVDIRIYLHEHPWTIDILKNEKPLGSTQALSWSITGDRTKMASGSLTQLNLDGTPAPELTGKILTVFAANEYGSAAVLASFFVTKVAEIKSGVSIDDIIVEREIIWSGVYFDNAVGPVDLTSEA